MSGLFNKTKSKKRKTEEEKKGKKKEEKKELEPKKKEDKVKKASKNKIPAQNNFSGTSVIKQPWITEKAKDMNANNKYVFLVTEKANKSEVKKEIEQRYEVSVEGVNILRKKVRPRKFRGKEGRARIIKKAIVTLKEGNSIEIFPV